jgi:diguanylate cyclase (GGDEF)-like protein
MSERLVSMLLASSKYENSLERHLRENAEDMKTLMAQHRALELRHKALQESHQRLTDSGQILGSLHRSTEELCLLIDLDGHICGSSDGARDRFQVQQGHVAELTQLVEQFHLPHLEMMLTGIANGDEDFSTEQTEFMLQPGGDPGRSSLMATNFLTCSLAGSTHILWIMRDLMLGMEDSLDTDRLSVLYRKLYQGAIVTNTRCEVLAVDHTFTTVSGHVSLDMHGRFPDMLQLRDGVMQQESILHHLEANGSWRGEITHQVSGRSPLVQWLSITAVKDDARKTIAYTWIFSDIEVLLNAERTVIDSAGKDALIGTPNFSLFRYRLDQKIDSAWRQGTHLAILYIALDRQLWQESPEHDTLSETILKTASTRIQEMIRGCDFIARSGPDRFVVFLDNLQEQSHLAQIAQRITDALAVPMNYQGRMLEVSNAIGCAYFPQDGVDTSMLLKNSETAMQWAAKAGKNRYQAFSMKSPAGTSRSNQAEGLADIPILQDELALLYQAHVTGDGEHKLLACEPQLRWHGEESNDLAQETRAGKHISATLWMLQSACDQLKNWEAIGLNEVHLVIPLEIAQLQSEAFILKITAMLVASELAPERLTLAVIQSGSHERLDGDGASVALQRLRNLGLQIVARYTSAPHLRLVQLKNLPVDALQAEFGFTEAHEVNDIHSAEQDWVAAMGMTLPLAPNDHTGADLQQYVLLPERSRHPTQSYLKSHPMPAAEFAYWALAIAHVPSNDRTSDSR